MVGLVCSEECGSAFAFTAQLLAGWRIQLGVSEDGALERVNFASGGAFVSITTEDTAAKGVVVSLSTLFFRGDTAGLHCASVRVSDTKDVRVLVRGAGGVRFYRIVFEVGSSLVLKGLWLCIVGVGVEYAAPHVVVIPCLVIVIDNILFGVAQDVTTISCLHCSSCLSHLVFRNK